MTEQLSFFDSEIETEDRQDRTEAEKQEFAEWKQRKREAKARFTAMQALPYEVKVRRAELRDREFMEQMDARGYNAHVSVGGLDSDEKWRRNCGIRMKQTSPKKLLSR